MSVNIYDKEKGKLIQIAGNTNGGNAAIDDLLNQLDYILTLCFLYVYFFNFFVWCLYGCLY